MKKITKSLMGCLLTLFIVALFVWYLGNILRPKDTDITVSAIKTFHELPENSVDVIGYGSSHMWLGLDTAEMHKNYGISAYNYGCNWQNINTTALFIKDSLRTQTPKVLLIETFNVDSVLLNTKMNGEIYYTRAISEFEGKRQYLQQCFGDDIEGYLSYYVPFAAFHENWINLDERSFGKVSASDNFINTRGYMSTDNVFPITIGDYTTFEQKKINAYSIMILDEIVEICKEKGIEIIFFTVPWQGEYSFGEAMKEYAEEKGYPYFNMFELIEEVGFDQNADFSDAGHLNNNGAKKVANYLGKYIVENYDVIDMRTMDNSTN